MSAAGDERAGARIKSGAAELRLLLGEHDLYNILPI